MKSLAKAPVFMDSTLSPDENGFVSHYDVEFSHGIEKAVPVSEMKVLEEGSHPTAEEHENRR